MKKSIKNLVIRSIVFILMVTSLSGCYTGSELEETHELVQLNYKLDESIRTESNAKAGAFLLVYASYESKETTEEVITYKYMYCYKRKDGGIIQDYVKINEDNRNHEKVVMYPLEKDKKPKLEVWKIVGKYSVVVEYRFYIDDATILEILESGEKEEQQEETIEETE